MCLRYLRIRFTTCQSTNVGLYMYLFTIPTNATRCLGPIVANIKLLIASLYGFSFICSTSCTIAGCFLCVGFTLTSKGVFTSLNVSMSKQLRRFPTFWLLETNGLFDFISNYLDPNAVLDFPKSFMSNSWERTSFTLLMINMSLTKIKKSSTYKEIKALSWFSVKSV